MESITIYFAQYAVTLPHAFWAWIPAFADIPPKKNIYRIMRDPTKKLDEEARRALDFTLQLVFGIDVCGDESVSFYVAVLKWFQALGLREDGRAIDQLVDKILFAKDAAIQKDKAIQDGMQAITEPGYYLEHFLRNQQ